MDTWCFKNSNHRLSFFHSIIPAIIILIGGLIFNNIPLIFGSISYISHLLTDMIDWGVNILFFNNKLVGLHLLWKKIGKRNMEEISEEYQSPMWFFNHLYYSTVYSNKKLMKSDMMLNIIK